ncbi:MFS transporter [Actinoplanes sp. GCM10030250]|uniref:MFS transporter n=1 Tax=Actinoplanes sp. GCM10030250 TaxID=3273376 RepID=UPI003610D931
MRAYRDLLAVPGVPALLLAAVLTRIAPPMLTLTVLLAVADATGSYATAGLALTGYAAALALCVPVTARLVDRYAPSRVLLGCLTGHVIAYGVLMTALALDLPAGALIAATVALGVTAPPAGPVVRATWPSFVPEERLHTAFALDGVLNEALYVLGPVVVSALLVLTEPIVVLGLVAATMTAGILVLLGVPAFRRRRAARAVGRRDYLGPLTSGQVRVLLTIITGEAVAFGAIVVGAPVAAAAAGRRDAAGILVGAISLGAVVSALVYGSRARGGSARVQLAVLNLGSAALLAAAGVAPILLVAGLALLGAGLLGGPRDTMYQLLLGEAASVNYRTEAYAWMGAATWAGYGLGSGFAGQLIHLSGEGALAAFVLAAGATMVAGLLSLLIRRAPADMAPAR